MTIENNLSFYATSLHSLRDFKKITNPFTRLQLREFSQNAVNRIHPFQKEFETDHPIVDACSIALSENGVTILRNLFSATEIADILEFIKDMEPQIRDKNIASLYYPSEVIYQGPHIFDKVFNKITMSIVAKYLGVTPTVINAELCKTTGDNVSGFEIIHRDRLDFHSLTFIIYLCDVDENGGATAYLKNSHTYEGMAKLIRSSKAEAPQSDVLSYFVPYISSIFQDDHSESLYEKVSNVFGDNLTLLTGNAGNLNIFDSFGYHAGTNVRSQARLALRIVFTLTPKIPFHKNDVLIPPTKVNSKEELPVWMKYIHRIFLDY